MKRFSKIKRALVKLGVLSIIIGCTQCASSQKLDDKAPVIFKDAYFQKWVGGIESAGWGYTFYLPYENNTNIKLDTIYFRDKSAKLEKKTDEPVYSANIKYPGNKVELIMDSDPKKEAKNEVPKLEKEKIPFELKENECVIRYTKNGKVGYFKIKDLKEKKLLAYPMQQNPNTNLQIQQ